MGQSGQEKTEQPTAKKRQDARKEGNIFQSRDIATVLILAGVFSGIRIWIPFIYGQLKTYMTWVIDGAARSFCDIICVFKMCASTVGFSPFPWRCVTWSTDPF